MPNVTTRRYYANFAPQQQLAAGITSGAISLSIAGSFAGWPATFPFYAVINYGQSDAEIIRIDSIVGATATIGERGSDGSPASSHSAGATLDACFIRKDMDEANAHSSATSAVHGVDGNVVGDTDEQTLTNKTLTSPKITDIDASAGGVLTITTGGGLVNLEDSALYVEKGVAAQHANISGNLKCDPQLIDAAGADAYYAAHGLTPSMGDITYLQDPLIGLYAHDGQGNWRQAASSSGLFQVASGYKTITPTPNTPTSVDVMFPFEFDTVPVVVPGIVGSVPGTIILGCSVSNVTTTGCTLWVTRTNNTDTTVSFIAISTGIV